MINNIPHTSTAIVEKPAPDEFARSLAISQTYHEMGEKHVVEMDVLEQLKSHMNQLEVLHGRLKFMMSEIQGLLKK